MCGEPALRPPRTRHSTGRRLRGLLSALAGPEPALLAPSLLLLTMVAAPTTPPAIHLPLVGPAPLAAQHEQTATTAPQPDLAPQPEEVLLEIRIGRAIARLVVAFRVGDTPYLPVADLLSLGEVDHELTSSGGLRAVRHPEGRIVTLDAHEGLATLDRAPVPASREMLWIDDRLLASVDLLADLFDLQFRTDWNDLSVLVTNPDALPVGRRLAREAGRHVAGNGATRPPADHHLPMAAHRVGGLVGDWSLFTDLSDPEATASGQLTLGSRVLGGTLRASARSAGPIREGDTHTALTWHLVRPGSRTLSQLRLGDGLSSGPRPRTLRGALLTNSPHMRDPDFGQETFTGRFGPGWEVELRRQGRTVDITRADEQGAFALDIPLRYGDNSVQVVAFGPHGEVVTMERLMVLRQDRLPAGRFEWALSGGTCSSTRCDGTANLDLHYGLTRRLTARAGLDAFASDSVGSALLPYLELSGSPHPALSLSGEGIPGALVRAGVNLAPSSRLRARAAATAFDRSAGVPALFDPRRQSTLEGDLLVRPLASHPRLLLRGSAVHEARDEGEVLRWQGQASVQLGAVRWGAGARGESRADPGVGWTRIVADATGRLPLGTRAARPWFRADTEWEDGSLARAGGRIGGDLARYGRLEAGGGWSRMSGSHLTLSFTADLAQLRATTQYRHDDLAGGRTVQTAHGSFQWDEAVGGVNLSPGSALDRSGLSGFVYLDENANGRWDSGEPLLEGVKVVVDGRTVVTDAHGRYRAWDLPSHQVVRVGLHEPSIPDPRWVPAHRTIDVELPPASFRRLDLRVVPSREIEGRVLRPGRDGNGSGVAGLELAIIDTESGHEVARVTTFSDGTFYATGIPPGRYHVRPDAGQLTALGLQPARVPPPLDARAEAPSTAERFELLLQPAAIVEAGGGDGGGS